MNGTVDSQNRGEPEEAGTDDDRNDVLTGSKVGATESTQSLGVVVGWNGRPKDVGDAVGTWIGRGPVDGKVVVTWTD